jgi:hypothetical protein
MGSVVAAGGDPKGNWNMSSLSAAAAVRAAMFALEALEPRRFLSGPGAVTETISLDIEAGLPLSGTLEVGQTISFEFQVTAGTQYFIKHSGWRTRASLLSEQYGSLLYVGDDGLLITAAQTETRHLLLYPKDDDSQWPLNYWIYAREFKDDYANEMADAAPISPAAPMLAHLDGADDVDWFSFDAEPGHVYRIRTDWIDGYGVDFGLYDSEGNKLETQSWYSADLVALPKEHETYFVKVAHNDSTSLGDLYQLSLDVLTDDAPNDFESAAPWDLSTVLSGALDYAGDMDYFSFEAKAGESWVFNQIKGLTTEIFDSDGTTIITGIEHYDAKDDLQGYALFTAPHEGVYYVAIEPRWGFMWVVAEGEYEIRAVPARDGGPAIQIAPGQTINDSLDQPGEIDHLSFEAAAGTFYEFKIAADHEKMDYVVRVVGPISASLYHSGDNTQYYPIFGPAYFRNVAPWLAPGSGTFEVEVLAFDASKTGSYSLTMTATVDDFGNGVDHAAPLAADQPRMARIDYQEDYDIFSAEIVEAHRYMVSIVLNGGEGRPYGGWMDDEYGESWCNHNETGTRCVLTPKSSGSRHFSVSGYAPQSYTISFHDITGPSPEEHNRILSEGAPLELVFDAKAKVEYFRIDAEADSIYRIRFNTEVPLFDVYFADADGKPVNWYRDLGYHLEREKRLQLYDPGIWTWSPPVTGTYYLAVASIDPYLVANYTMSLESAIAPAPEFFAPQTLEVGSTIIGEVNKHRNDRFFRFEAAAGTEYEFTILGTNYMGTVTLLAGDGHTPLPVELSQYWLDYHETYYDHFQSFTWTAPASGSYYVALEDETLYRISAAVAPVIPDRAPDPESVNQNIASAAGVIDAGGADIWRFHAFAGRSYRFRTVLGTLDDSVLGLFDPLTQEVIAVNDDTEDEAVGVDDEQLYSSEIIWTADRSGEVLLLVYAYDPQSGGSYRLEVYSASEALKEEILAAVAILPGSAEQMAEAMDDALYGDEEEWWDESDDWDDGEEGWDESDDWDEDWLDEEVWEADEEW